MECIFLYFKDFFILISNTVNIYEYNSDKHKLSQVITNFKGCKVVLRPESLRGARLSEVGIHRTLHCLKDETTLSFPR